MKKILIVNSLKENNSSFLNLFNELKGFDIATWSSNQFFLDNFSKNKLNRKIYLPDGLMQKGRFKFFVLLSVFFYGLYFLRFIFSLKREKVYAIVCVSMASKIIFTPLAILFFIKIFWIDENSDYYNDKSWLAIFILRVLSYFSKNIVFTETEERVMKEKGFLNINNISLGISCKRGVHQDNIFSKLAKTESPMLFSKNFTIGVVADLDDSSQVKALFTAVKTCLTFIPGLQLVIIGSGKEKKNLSWLSRKMEIEKSVLFVGSQDYLGKWLENFDIYVTINKSLKLFDLEVVLEAMFKKLPIIAFWTKNLEEVLGNAEAGVLIEDISSDALARKIIEVEQDRRRLKMMGENASVFALKYFKRDVQIGKLNKILNI